MRTLSSLVLLTFAALTACDGSSKASIDAGTSGIAGIELMRRLSGLWSGPATNTRLGDFPLKNMDLRPLDDSILFGRVDIDAQSSLRFMFAVEVHDDAPVLVFRNGGLFMGLTRDTRTKLMEVDDDRYRFCALDGGCEYVEATFELISDDAFELTVMVKGQLHESWNATRVETRDVPSTFPARTDLPGDQGFPEMASAAIQVGWPTPLDETTDVWVILSTTSCIPSGACQFSRWISGSAEAGATSLTVDFDQLHSGSYFVLGVVDRDHNLETTRLPTSGDYISVPSPSLVVTSDGSMQLTTNASYSFP
jgi:hypothetical protein